MKRATYTEAEAPSFAIVAVAATIVTWGLASPLIKAASVGGEAMAFYGCGSGRWRCC